MKSRLFDGFGLCLLTTTNQTTADDLLLIYFSGHGIRDFTDGQLYFATVDTQLVQQNVRRSTAVAAHFVNQLMSNSHSRRQILLLDCCYSGAFKEGMLAKGGNRAGAPEQFDGLGRIVLTASDALQYSFEGAQVQGEGVRSVFTRALVEGLESGRADLDRDGWYALDEVYDYIYAQVTEQQPGQKPMKMGYVEGKIIIGNNPRPVAAHLPPELRESLEDRRPWVRLGAVHELRNLLASGNKGLMLASRAALTALATGDDSQEVRTAAQQYWAVAAAGAGAGTEDPGAVGRERAERERLSAEEAERQRIAKTKAERAAQDLQRAEGEAVRQRSERAKAERAVSAAGEQIASESAAYAAADHRGRLEDWKAF